jgi:hypothetical protein
MNSRKSNDGKESVATVSPGLDGDIARYDVHVPDKIAQKKAEGNR